MSNPHVHSASTPSFPCIAHNHAVITTPSLITSYQTTINVFDYKRTADVPVMLPLINKNQPAGSLNVQLHSEENIPAHVKEAASAVKPAADDAKNDASGDIEFYDPDTTPPEKMVGVRISVKWAGNKWFPGVITEYNDVSKEHRVLYDDKEARLIVCFSICLLIFMG